MEEGDYTSVVIELENQEEPESQKTYKFDFDDTESPKDYVIDQIFCGDNITVYALFEISEVINSKSNKQLVEVTDLSVNDDYKFYHKNSYSKAVNVMKTNDNKHDILMRDFDEALVSGKNQTNESFYCLKRFKSNEVLIRKEDSRDLKVLYAKDFMSKNSNAKKFKAVSKGVNTDITQSPKLLDKVHEAMNVNFPLVAGRNKALEIISTPSRTPSYEVIETDERSSFSSLTSEFEVKKNNGKSIPNFLIVPLLMMGEGKLNQSKKDEKTSKVLEEKKCLPEPDANLKKISISMNTDIAGLNLKLTGELNTMKEETINNENVRLFENETKITDEKGDQSNVKVDSKLSNEEKILEEIKDLQWKLNTIIESLKLKDNASNANDSLENSQPSLKSFSNKEEKNTADGASEASPVGFKPAPKNHKKFDDLPIFSPVSLMPPSNRHLTPKTPKKLTNVVGDVKNIAVTPAKSTSYSSLITEHLSSTADSVLDKDAKEDFNWETLVPCRGVGASKSDSNNRCLVLVRKHSCLYGLKKSLSFDVKEEKLDGLGIKKVKNTSFKLEASIKAKPDIKIIHNAESPFSDNLALVKGEMGDEATKRIKTSKVNLLDLSQTVDKNESDNKEAKKDPLDIKSKREEEGDAKLSYQKQHLLNSKFGQNAEKVTVQYCSTNTPASESLFKSDKVSASMKGKVASGSKITQSSDRPSTPNKGSRKVNKEDSVGLKEPKTPKKLIKIMEKPIKYEKKEAMSEIIKQKSVSASRKSAVRGTAESKLHVDRLIKKGADDSKVECINNCKNSQQTKLVDERTAAKSETCALLSRPPRKRECRESTPVISHNESKERKTPVSEKNSDVLIPEDSDLLSENLCSASGKENIDQVMVFESHTDPIPKFSQENVSESKLPNPSSVIVELFSKKPSCIDEVYSGVHQDLLCGKKSSTEISNTGTSSHKKSDTCNEDDCEKPVVKSVWALTKVLLYEDGSKKFEVLEASLTPPEYLLKNDNSTDDKRQ